MKVILSFGQTDLPTYKPSRFDLLSETSLFQRLGFLSNKPRMTASPSVLVALS